MTGLEPANLRHGKATLYQLSYGKKSSGDVAKRQGSGLQIRHPGFDSRRRLLLDGP